MLSLFNKKEEVKPEPITPPVDPNPVFEVGKERTYKDPKSGEFVYQRAMTAEQKSNVMKALQKNAAHVNAAVQLSRQFAAVLKTLMDNDNKIAECDKEIGEAVQRVRDEQKISKQWLLNPNLMILERREPPEG